MGILLSLVSEAAWEQPGAFFCLLSQTFHSWKVSPSLVSKIKTPLCF